MAVTMFFAGAGIVSLNRLKTSASIFARVVVTFYTLSLILRLLATLILLQILPHLFHASLKRKCIVKMILPETVITLRQSSDT